MYLVKTPWWLRTIYPDLIWRVPTNEKLIYLSFDDGPHEKATPFVLNQLKKYNAKATFFCIGKNARLHPTIYQNILAEGHAVGNHTEHHINGWKVNDQTYLEDIELAAEVIKSNLFRPPYGRITRSQSKSLIKDAQFSLTKIIMWDILSGDFDLKLNGTTCAEYVIKHAKAGSIVVFHDSSKAWDRMSIALPMVLDYFSKKGFRFVIIPQH